MKAVILSAGKGTRLMRHSESLPKVLIKVHGHSIIYWVLQALKNRINDVYIVVGYKDEMIKKELKRECVEDVFYIFNPEYHEKGITYSLLCCKNFLKEEFLLVMGDTLIDPQITKKLIEKKEREGISNKLVLCVDKDLEKPDYRIEDSVKVLEKNGYILKIGKKVKTYNALDTGVFLMPKDVFNVIESKLTGREETLSKLVEYFAKRRRALVCDITGFQWLDVDFMEDVEIAKKWNFEKFE